MGTPTLQQYLQFLKDKGYSLFKASAASKEPANKGWQKQNMPASLATTGLQNRWFNVGVAMQPGQVVVDIDNHPEKLTKLGKSKDGLQSKANLEQALGISLDDTFTVRTPSGGFHHYFTVPADVRLRGNLHKEYPGIDIKKSGGYVMAPGCTHPEFAGVYTVLEPVMPILPMP